MENYDDKDNLEIDLRSATEKKAAEKIESLENELATLQPGVQVILERLRPSWCKGQLEKITIGEDGLDLDYLIRTWGGHLISVKVIGEGSRIRGSHSVELYTFDPRRYGKLIRAPNSDDTAETLPNHPLVNSAPPVDSGLLPQMIEIMNQQRQSEIDTLKTLLLAQQQQAQLAQPTAPSMSNNFTEVLKMAKTVEQLKDMFGSKDAPSVDSDTEFTSQIMGLLGGMFSKDQQQPKGGLVPPINNPIQAQKPPPPTRIPTITPIRDRNVIQEISSMPPDKAAETLIASLGTMDPEKKDQTIMEFMKRYDQFQSEQNNHAPEYEDESEYEDDEPTEGVR